VNTEVQKNEIILSDSGFWVLFRRRGYGPFDYQWSLDLHGIEFTYQGEKFGEVCSRDEFYADLKPFELPMTVCRAAAIAAAMIAQSISEGTGTRDRVLQLQRMLVELDVPGFQVRLSDVSPA
jgi:hypothetical protein